MKKSTLLRHGAPSGVPNRLVRRLFASSEERELVAALELGLEAIEEQLQAEAASTEVVLGDVVQYLVAAGGKRVRPLLTLLTAQLGDGTTDEVVNAAVALELTHVATLYHDDVMDEADIRRSVPSANRLWGNNAAVLAGDVLSARAYQIAAQLRPDMVALHAHTFERLVTGQLNETLGPQGDADPINHYLSVLADKTGSLIACAAEIGLVLADGPDAYRFAVRDYGEAIGVAFQLIDDVIDLTSTEEQLGKRPGTDLREGVPTLPLLLLRASAQEHPDDAVLLTAIERDLRDDETTPAALAALAAHPVTTETVHQANEWAERAKAALDPIDDGVVKTALMRFADYLVDRSN